ncbi:MAG: MFS transporter [Candidatus Helarchaeota archaeon]
MLGPSEINYKDLESPFWTKYHTFLVWTLSINRFFNLFMIVFTGLSIRQIANAINVNSITMIIIFAIMNLGSGLALFLRYIADIIGRKKTFIVMHIGLMMAYGISAMATNVLFFIISRLAVGIFSMNVSGLIITEEVPAKYRGRAIGLTEGIGMTSSILASYLAVFLEINLDYWREIFWLMAIIGIIIQTIFAIFIKETRRYKYFLKNNNNRSFKQAFFGVFKRKYLKFMILSISLFFCINGVYQTIKRYYPAFLIEERGFLGFNTEIVGYWSIFLYISSIIGYSLCGFISDHIGRKKTISISAASYFLGSLFVLVFYNMYIIFIGFIIINFCFAIFINTASVLTVEYFSTEDRSIGSGWNSIIINFLSIFGNFSIFLVADPYLGLGLGWGNSFLLFGSIYIIGVIIIPQFFMETKSRVIEEIYIQDIERNIEI